MKRGCCFTDTLYTKDFKALKKTNPRIGLLLCKGCYEYSTMYPPAVFTFSYTSAVTVICFGDK